MIRLLAVDDHTIFRSGLKRLLSDEPDIRVVDEAKDGAEMLDKLSGGHFDLVLLDINMGGRGGLEMLASVREREDSPPVLVLSMYPDEQFALVALRAGANGYIAKDAEAKELVRAIRLVASGGRYLSERATQRMLQGGGAASERPVHERLSSRELQIMLMIVQGLSLTEIGTRMFISVKTVSTHRTRILAKLGMDSNAELVLYAVRHKMID